jgi:hypothetical protein
MSGFSRTTAFEIARQLAATGEGNPSLYLLICDPDSLLAVQDELLVEIRVQLGVSAEILQYAGPLGHGQSGDLRITTKKPVLMVAHEVPSALIRSFDLHIVLLTNATVLVLTGPEIAGRILVSAPHLRSRLTDVFNIQPERSGGGAF